MITNSPTRSTRQVQTVRRDGTVERHLSNCYAKLGVGGKSARAAAAEWLRETTEHASRSGIGVVAEPRAY